ncbi:hypothetical protein [Nocardia rhizosphaerae]|uniref:Uncharacterized protein n=1 Tax=Nocardia rhizosphaerae TaxID=1691571 RepID=A0ABV8LA66_9NOCA
MMAALILAAALAGFAVAFGLARRTSTPDQDICTCDSVPRSLDYSQPLFECRICGPELLTEGLKLYDPALSNGEVGRGASTELGVGHRLLTHEDFLSVVGGHRDRKGTHRQAPERGRGLSVWLWAIAIGASWPALIWIGLELAA